ncbi:hypothetical protein ApDm4_1568 [Acetobacter pomorum]|nr:hypothetical protein ApDm4_1568 [Acetobacter pomorum]
MLLPLPLPPILPFWQLCHSLRIGTRAIAQLYIHFARLKGFVHTPTLNRLAEICRGIHNQADC